MTVAFKRQTESQKLPTWYLTVKCLVINVWIVLLPPAPQTKIISLLTRYVFKTVPASQMTLQCVECILF